MELICGIICLIIATFFSTIIYIFLRKDNTFLCSALLGGFAFVFLIIGIGFICEYSNPSITPIDVYRGKTTLEITYKDTIAIDSVVVWKEEVK
jgi:hypothetical protein